LANDLRNIGLTEVIIHLNIECDLLVCFYCVTIAWTVRLISHEGSVYICKEGHKLRSVCTFGRGTGALGFFFSFLFYKSTPYEVENNVDMLVQLFYEQLLWLAFLKGDKTTAAELAYPYMAWRIG
jgi:hypothetical protein